jgi:hypothetical protein
MNGTIEVVPGGSQLFEIISFVRQAGETHSGVSVSETLYPDRYAIKFIEGSEPDHESSSGPVHCRVTATDLLGNKAITVFEFTIANDTSDDAPDWHHSTEPGEAYAIFDIPEGSFQTSGVDPHDWALTPSTEVPTTLSASRAGNGRTDPSTQPSYQLVAGTGDDDNDSVELLPASAGADENRIVFKNAIDADDGAQTIYKIRVRATNYVTLGAGGTPQYSEQQIRIRVTNSTFDDSPVLNGGHLLTTIDEGNDTSSTAQNPLAGILNLRNHIDGVNINASGDLIDFTKNYNGSNYTFSIANGTGGKLGTSTNPSSFGSTYFSVINGPLQRQAWLTLTGSHGDGADFEYYSSADHFGLSNATYTNTIYIKIVATNPAGGSPVSKIVGVRIKNNTADDKPTWAGGGATGGIASSSSPFQLAEGVDLNLALNDLISSSQKATTNTFTIDGSYNDGNKFTISNGALKFITTPDFENPTDQGGVSQDNLYLVKVTATNSRILGQGGSQQQSSQVLYIQVTDDATDNVPQWSASWDPGLLTVSELGPVNTVIYNIPLSVDTNAYTITENASVGSLANAFHIENNTQIRTHATTPLDLTNEQDSTFTIKIAPVNESSGNASTYVIGQSRSFTIKVANVLSDEFNMNSPFQFTVQPTSSASQNNLIDFVDNSFYPDFEWDGTTTADYTVDSGEAATGDPKPVYVSKGNGHQNTNDFQIIWYSNPSGSNLGGTLDTNNPTWLVIDFFGVDGDFSGGNADISSGSVAFPSSSFNLTQS